MMHTNRVWCVAPVESVSELANKLTQHSWCCCAGFELGNYLWLNDATGGDGAQEYAVLRKPSDDDPHYRQVETITASWCNEHQMLAYINSIQSDATLPVAESGLVVHARSSREFLDFLGITGNMQSPVVEPTIETPGQHGRCHHCA